MNFEPIAVEHTNLLCKISFGKIPDEFINGIYVRNGPNGIIGVNESKDKHWADGHGHLHSLTFKKDDGVYYSNRFVQTDLYKTEKSTGKEICPSLTLFFGKNGINLLRKGILYIIKCKILGVKHFSKANTAVIKHMGTMLALAENGCPYSVNLNSLTTVGPYTFNGVWGPDRNGYDGFTAHPKRCPDTGKLYVVGYDPIQKPYLRYSVIDEDGTVLISRKEINTVDKPVMIHDFAITKNYVVICIHPLNFNITAPLWGKPILEFHENMPTRWIAFQKDNPSKIIGQFICSSAAVMHVANAWEEDDEKIVVYGCRMKKTNFSDLKKMDAPYMYRWELNLKTNDVVEKIVSDISVDFPTVKPHEVSKKSEFIYASITENVDGIWNTLRLRGYARFKTDAIEKSVKTYNLPHNVFGGECSFVYHSKKLENSCKQYLITFVHEEEQSTSKALVINADSMNCVCIIDIPARIPYGFHGLWFPSNTTINNI